MAESLLDLLACQIRNTAESGVIMLVFHNFVCSCNFFFAGNLFGPTLIRTDLVVNLPVWSQPTFSYFDLSWIWAGFEFWVHWPAHPIICFTADLYFEHEGHRF